jgi:hypothetical protein
MPVREEDPKNVSRRAAEEQRNFVVLCSSASLVRQAKPGFSCELKGFTM